MTAFFWLVPKLPARECGLRSACCPIRGKLELGGQGFPRRSLGARASGMVQERHDVILTDRGGGDNSIPNKLTCKALRMKILSRFFAPLLLAAALTWANPASADTVDLANNLGQTNFSTAGISNTNWNAQAFTTDATHTVITGVAAKFSRDSGSTGNMGIYIYSSASNQPGSPVATVGTYDIATQLNTSLTNTAFSLNLPIVLNPSTQYFLVIGGISITGLANWGFTTSTGGTGFPSYNVLSTDGGATWGTPSDVNPQQMQIEASIPEPASLGLMGIGMVGWFLTRRRTARG